MQLIPLAPRGFRTEPHGILCAMRPGQLAVQPRT
jgi:hypothetical protein